MAVLLHFILLIPLIKYRKLFINRKRCSKYRLNAEKNFQNKKSRSKIRRSYSKWNFCGFMRSGTWKTPFLPPKIRIVEKMALKHKTHPKCYHLISEYNFTLSYPQSIQKCFNFYRFFRSRVLKGVKNPK